MEYYYDIYLNFNEYPINYYEWENNDEIERVLKIPIIKVESIKEFIEYKVNIDIDLNKFIITDGINSVALELINGSVAYLSYLTYEDEESVNELAYNLPVTKLNVEYKSKRDIPFELRKDSFIKKVFKSFLENSDKELLKYIYFDITNKTSSDISKIKNFLIQDIEINFGDKYINIYDKICK